MKLFSAEQIRRWDAYTIAQEGIRSFTLMQRAAGACSDWIATQRWSERPFVIFCGKGNNGGDGLVIAKNLLGQGYYVEVYILEFGKLGTPDFQEALQALHAITEDIHFIQSTDAFPYIDSYAVVIDALFASGLNKPLDGLSKSMVEHINGAGALIVSIDLPSGLYLDAPSTCNTIIRANHTLTFGALKLGLVVQDNAHFIGEVEVLDIGLHPHFEASEESPYETVDPAFVKAIYRPRTRFAHKGTYGHALLAAGSWGKMGAAVLAAKACLRSGVGLLTCYIPACGYSILQTALPEAMALTDDTARLLTTLPPGIEKYTAVGVGPGIGTDAATGAFLSALIEAYRQPLVLDADALNLLAGQPQLLKTIPPGSILTPHPKEFDRLFGAHDTDFDRLATARRHAAEGGNIILLKGHHTAIATPSGTVYFNTTGNAGLAKGGSGDVLTGILTSLLAQGYAPVAAAVLGVYLHGAAADACAAAMGMESMLPGDLCLFLGGAFRELVS